MIRILLLIFLLPTIIFARARFVPKAESPEAKLRQPWFTGPLLAAGSTTIPVGHWNIQPYFFMTEIPARYNRHWHAESIPTFLTQSTIVPLWVGLTDWMDFQIQPQWLWNHRDHEGGHWTLGDFSAEIEFQFYRDSFPTKNWIPSIKFAIREFFPTGSYRNFHSNRASVEQGGLGSWATSFILVVGRMFHLGGLHYLSTRIDTRYTIFAPVHVKGFNSFGGGFGTDGTAYPKPSAMLDLACELSLTRNWAIALDLIGRWVGRNDFSGKPGVLPNGEVASNTSPSFVQYSIAPAIEYNFNANVGIIAGPWITFAGKNSNKFYTGVISLNYYQ